MPILTTTPLEPMGTKFPTGLIPESQANKVRRASRTAPFIPSKSAPAELAYVPKRLSYWGNNRYGICVTSEEAFAKVAQFPEFFWEESLCIAWARKYGWLNGASLDGVMDDMIADGFSVGSQRYHDGKYKTVDWGNEAILRAALGEVGIVKIAMNANALPSGAGSQQGWYVRGDNSNTNSNHCVSIAGYGSADYLYSRLEVTRPSAVPANAQGYLVFTWSTIGFVDHEWIMGCTDEAFVRNPTTVGVPPLPIPGPPTPPPPPPPPPGPPAGDEGGELFMTRGGVRTRYLVVPTM